MKHLGQKYELAKKTARGLHRIYLYMSSPGILSHWNQNIKKCFAVTIQPT